MIILLKITAILFSGILFLGYGWWDRDYLNYAGKILTLSPAYSLLIIGVIPFSFFRLSKIKLIFTIIFLIGALQTIREIIGAFNLPIEADMNAAALNIIILIILSTGIYMAWKAKVKKEIEKK